jgi:hypothetical protein
MRVRCLTTTTCRGRLAALEVIAPLVVTALVIAPAIAGDARNSIPDLSGQWGRDMAFFEPPESGPGPIHIVARKPDGNLVALPQCCAIPQLSSEQPGWLGDPTNPILKPEAAEAVKRFNALSVGGKAPEDLHNSCWPEPPPFVMSLHFGVEIMQQPKEVTFIYLLRNTVRHVRLNESHSRDRAPDWQGDSVGWYENGELVIDTTGIRAAPISTVDPFGTPHTSALHVIERYRVIDGMSAAEAQEKNGARNRAAPPYGRGIIDPDITKTGLQVTFTVEDAGVFTKPWSGRVTYRRLIGEWPEAICAENPHYLGGSEATPIAKVADF